MENRKYNSESPHLSMIKSFINERHPIKGNEFNFIEKKTKKSIIIIK